MRKFDYNPLMDARGQALVEYAILASMFVLTVSGISGLYLNGLGDYYQRLAAIVSLPIP